MAPPAASARPVTSIGDLALRLAPPTADLRDALLQLLDRPSAEGARTAELLDAWRAAVQAEAAPRDFADGMAQVVACGMVLAALSGVEPDGEGGGTAEAAQAALRGTHPVMSAAFGPLLEPPLRDAVHRELAALESLCGAIDVERLRGATDARGEPWLCFYEDFLGVYDPEQRKRAGVYYTPTAVVRAMVAMVDRVLVDRFGLRAGFADASVVTLDPAVGTGTFPLAVLDRAAARMEQLRGPAGRAQAAANLSANLHGFELLPGPYAVSHLRLTERLRELDPELQPTARVVLTDTLDSPEGLQEQNPLFGEGWILAEEQNRARRIKAQERVTVVLGNPPYRRLARGVRGRGAGGWVLDGRVPGRRGSKALFDDLLDVAREHTMFSHTASLYNLYVYFWRWAIWKAFEAHGPGPGVVAFITGSSWLTGPGFVGLRQLARATCDEVWVLDLGGDNKGPNPEENVFAIETPVAIALLVRTAEHDPAAPARVRYRRLSGTREEKLAAAEAIAAQQDPLGGEWSSCPDGPRDRMVPATGDAAWRSYPALADLFPWQQPGCKFGRLWPIAPSPELLHERWRRFVAAAVADRPALFQTSRFGRGIHTEVAGHRRLADELPGAAPPPARPYGYRSFDRQWAFDDPRLAALERPSLWGSASDRQVFLTTLITKPLGPGPALCCTPDVPDLDVFCGRGGKDILPLYRDAAATEPNLPRGLLKALGDRLGAPAPTPEDLAAYVYALLSAPDYHARFEDALATPGPRVPITADPALWAEAVSLGGELLWLHTFGARFRGAARGRFVPPVDGLAWRRRVEAAPQTAADVGYDAGARTLQVGDGVVEGVPPEVWEFTVSRMPVVKKWLGYRTARGAGRAASSKNPLDRVRPTAWPDAWSDDLLDLLRVLTLTVDRQAAQADLLDRVCRGPSLPGSALPAPTPRERKPPKRG